MSFVVLTGKRGSGKTALAVKRIIDELKNYRSVWINFRIHIPTAISQKCYYATEIEDIADMRHGLFVLDEAHLKISSRNWQNFSELVHACLSLSRHLDMDIIFISQNFRRLDTVARELADSVFICRKFGRLTIWKSFDEDDINAEGRPKEKARSIKTGFLWHTKKLHETYDDKEILFNALQNRPIRTWEPSGNGWTQKND